MCSHAARFKVCKRGLSCTWGQLRTLDQSTCLVSTCTNRAHPLDNARGTQGPPAAESEPCAVPSRGRMGCLRRVVVRAVPQFEPLVLRTGTCWKTRCVVCGCICILIYNVHKALRRARSVRTQVLIPRIAQELRCGIQRQSSNSVIVLKCSSHGLHKIQRQGCDARESFKVSTNQCTK